MSFLPGFADNSAPPRSPYMQKWEGAFLESCSNSRMGSACLAGHLCVPNNCILPFISCFLQVSMGDHGQWIRGNFSFNGKYPEFSSLKGRWQPRGLMLLQCPPVPALSRPREGSALGRVVRAAGWTDGQTDGQMDAGPPRAGRWCWGSAHPGAAPCACSGRVPAATSSK